MKRFQTIAFSLLISLALFTASCKKDDKPSGGSATPTPTSPVSLMTATINGTHWRSDSSEFSYFLVNNGCGEAYGQISGGGYNVFIDIQGATAAGNSFVLGPLSSTIKAVVEVNDTNGNIYTTNHPNGNGQLIVSSFNTSTRSVSLAFSGTLVEMSSGDFLTMSNANFTYSPYFGSFPNNSISANLNGQPFQPCAAFALNDQVEDQMVIVGQGPGNQYIELFFPNFVTVGSILPLAGLTELYVTGDTINMDNSSLSSGQITITTFNQSTKRISGTFSAQGINNSTGNQVTINQGSFDMIYQEFQSLQDPGNAAQRAGRRHFLKRAVSSLWMPKKTRAKP